MIAPNPVFGVVLHWLGGLASGSFYLPFRAVRKWSWETAWLIGGIFSWILAPLLIAGLLSRDLLAVLRETPDSTKFWCFFFGLLWGFGGLTFGLTMRYLGMSLGMALALGYCAVFGTLAPPIFAGHFAERVLSTRSGEVILGGVAVCLMGILFAARAGMSKEKDLSPEESKVAIPEFDLRKGILVATFCGVMSACFSFGLAAGEPIRTLSLRHGTPELWQGLPVLVIVLLGGFTTNAVWCISLNFRNHSGTEYFSGRITERADAGTSVRHEQANGRVPLAHNYFFSALAGVIWYFQFFFYTMGETQMGRFRFSSWTLHMASIMIFGALWGLALHEWRGASKKTMRLLWLSLASLVASTIIVGYGNYLGTRPS